MAPVADLRSPITRGGGLTLALTALAIACGVLVAIHKSWLSDDAFISFRYARQFVRGFGLVYNAGERVEGYSNFLWTMWLAAGMRLGVRPEVWSNAWSIACYAGSIALLGAHRVRSAAAAGTGAVALAIPVAALGAALHPDWAWFATSGLETSLFTLLLVAAWVLLARDDLRPRHAAGAGFVLALAALTRPEGILFVAMAAPYAAWRGRPRPATLFAFVGLFLAGWVPYVAWKISYYGEYFPNTYYAKSAAIAWWSQGWFYVGTFFMRSIVLAMALPFAALAAFDRQGGADPAPDPRGPIALAAAFALGLTLFVMRVGGDFMFARLLVPAIPFYLLLMEYGIDWIARGRARVAGVAGAIALVLVVCVPYPFRGRAIVRGINNEWEVYPRSRIAEARRQGEALHHFFNGLPVRVAFVGSQAMLMYYADPTVAIESQAGLTDRRIARQPLEHRGRIGHEKVAPLAYLLEGRHVDLVLGRNAEQVLALDDSLPEAAIRFGDVAGRIVCWNDSLLAEFRRRGARFEDLGAVVDQCARQLSAVPDAHAEAAIARVRRFWFAGEPDPERRARFVDALMRSHPAALALLAPPATVVPPE